VKKWILIVLVVFLGLVFVAAGGGYLWFQKALKKGLPQTLGELELAGLKEKVQVIRDTYGVPHIYAKSEPDLFFALGYTAAQDRFWQMEFYRRLGHGRLSEVLGKDFVEVDRYFRLLTAAGLNREIPENLTFMYESFADGVNAYLESHQDRLPIEFSLVGYAPEPWADDDYLAILKVVNWGLSIGWEVDLTAAEMLEKVGEQKLRDAFPPWPGDGPLVIPEATKSLSKLLNPVKKTIHLVRSLTPISAPAASNNWVVSGKRSITGKPILANDTHLQLNNPSLWWEVHLVCPTINVSGFVLLGMPAVPVGHNLSTAWGVTNVMVDDTDFFIEKINPENPRQYWYKDQWEDMKVIEEIIPVKGEEPVKTEILLTRHGPIVNEERQGSEHKAVSARWAFTEAQPLAMASYLLLKAENIGDVKRALRYWEVPGQNFVFADTQGSIGYWCSAAIPIRSRGDGLLPVPAWTGEYEWKGFVPFVNRPHLLNPEEGFIATANNKIISASYPYVISHYWEPMDRITRIRQLLTDKAEISVEDIKSMHQDNYCVLAAEMTPYVIDVLKGRFSDENAQEAADILSGWDFIMDEYSVGACLFAVTFKMLMENVFKDELGKELFEDYVKTVSFPPRAIRMMFRKGSSPWFDNVNTPEAETLEDLMVTSLSQAFDELKDTIGGEMDRWTWGRIHTLTFEHVLGKKKPLDLIFNLGPFPVGGNNLTINKKQYPYNQPYRVNHGVSQRMIVDFSNMHKSLHVLPTGESGHLKSPHHKDQIELYLGGRYHTAWTNRVDVEKNSEAILILRPKAK